MSTRAGLMRGSYSLCVGAPALTYAGVLRGLGPSLSLVPSALSSTNGTRCNEDSGIFIQSAINTIVGGNTTTLRNVVSGNGFDGIDIAGSTLRNKVVGNRIGTTASGTGPLGNARDGLVISGSENIVGDGTSLGANTIAFNGRAGINVSFGTTNRIDHNSIFSNDAIGIDLVGGVQDAAGRTANDPGDADTGPNGLQNFPVITSAKTVSGTTTIQATLNTMPNPDADVIYVIQFFSNPSGGDEGKTFIGELQFKPDASGNATFTFSPSSPVAVGNTITATAQSSSPVPADDGNTSEFSAPRTVTAS